MRKRWGPPSSWNRRPAGCLNTPLESGMANPGAEFRSSSLSCSSLSDDGIRERQVTKRKGPIREGAIGRHNWPWTQHPV
jgi:hypothetical protein